DDRTGIPAPGRQRKCGDGVQGCAASVRAAWGRARPGLGTHVLTMDTPIGRKVEPQFIKHGTPLIRTKLKDLSAAGIERVARVVGVRDGRPELADERVLDVTNVIWCTGFRAALAWIDVPVF